MRRAKYPSGIDQNTSSKTCGGAGVAHRPHAFAPKFMGCWQPGQTPGAVGTVHRGHAAGRGRRRQKRCVHARPSAVRPGHGVVRIPMPERYHQTGQIHRPNMSQLDPHLRSSATQPRAPYPGRSPVFLFGCPTRAPLLTCFASVAFAIRRGVSWTFRGLRSRPGTQPASWTLKMSCLMLRPRSGSLFGRLTEARFPRAGRSS